MIYQEILNSRNISETRFPLWKLKVTDMEYQALKNELSTEYRCHNNFNNCRKETLLYYAEWWRREYVAQPGHKYINVFKSLGVDSNNIEESAKLLKETAWQQFIASQGIPTIVNNHTWRVYSMLYQGGLPLGVIVPREGNTKEHNNWSRLLRDMMFDNVDFEDANDNVLIVAHSNESIREFCETLVSACHEKDREAMPLDCQEDNPIYHFLMEEVDRIEQNHHNSHPISIKWEFKVDDIDHKIAVTAIVNGRRSFSSAFLEQIGETSDSSFTLRLSKTDQEKHHTETLGIWDFFNGFTQSRFQKRIKCSGNSTITITKDGVGNPIIQKELDLDTPVILCKDEETNSYFSCERLKNKETLVLVPSGWSVVDLNIVEDGQPISSCGEYILEHHLVNVLKITPDETINLVLQNEEGDRFPISLTVFNSTTRLRTHNPYDDNFIAEPIYEQRHLKFCEEYNDARRIKEIENVKFRLHGQKKWMEPGYIPIGNIDACIITHEDRYVKPLNLIYIGTAFKYSIENKSKDSCNLKINWDSGDISIRNAEKNDDGSWAIHRANCPYIVECTPTDRPENTFELTLNSPFKEVRIYNDENETEIEQNSYIPLSTIHSYSYHIDDNVRIKIDGENMFNINVKDHFLEWQDIKANKIIQLKKYGPVTHLLGSIGKIRDLLDFKFDSLVEASINVTFQDQDKVFTSFNIKDYPFRLKVDDQTVRIIDEKGHPVNITPNLHLCSLTNPEYNEINLDFNEESKTYHIPALADNLGTSLIFGSRMVLPKAYHPVENTRTIEEKITEDLQKAELYSDVINRCRIWFNRCGDTIPFSSILDLRIMSNNPDALLKFALQCFLDASDNDDKILQLNNELLLMQKDLVFYWWWLCNYNFQEKSQNLIANCNEVRFNTLKIKYAFATHDAQALDPNNEDPMLPITIINYFSSRFNQFMHELILDSIAKDLQHNDQGFLTDGKEHLAAMLFNQEVVLPIQQNALNDFLEPIRQFPLGLDYSQYLEENYLAILNEYQGLVPNERIFLISARLMYEHLNKNINLFNLNCAYNISIRRSIMYSFQHLPGHFFYFMKHPNI